jgi:dTDP-4-amino-4,6-dideoxy-D-galactose acyltransferase
MANAELCEFLEWDSKFFARRIARVATGRLNVMALERILSWCQANAIDCLYFLSDVDDQPTVALAEDNQFRLVDIRLTLQRQLGDVPHNMEDRNDVIRPWLPADLPALQRIARTSHHDSRFYYDPNFPPALCDSLYMTWVERSCRGYANSVFVAEQKGCAAGYITCHLPAHTHGQIGLLGVSAEARGTGLGKRLVGRALRWFTAQGAEQITVVTQGRNVSAQRFYQTCGFATLSAQLWFHRWFH